MLTTPSGNADGHDATSNDDDDGGADEPDRRLSTTGSLERHWSLHPKRGQLVRNQLRQSRQERPPPRSSSTSYSAKRYDKRRFHARSIAAARARAKARAIAAAEAAAVEKIELAEATDIENSTISTASLDNDETIETEVEAKDEPEISSNVGCKKFFPTVGMTLTVPCE